MRRVLPRPRGSGASAHVRPCAAYGCRRAQQRSRHRRSPTPRALRHRRSRCRPRCRAVRAGAPAPRGSPGDRPRPECAPASFWRRTATAFAVRGIVRSVVLSGESAGAACSVNVTVKVEPAFGWLSTAMSPFISCARRRTIERPSPVPPKRRVVDESACAKGWNRRARCSSVRPMPVSVTAIVTLVLP